MNVDLRFHFPPDLLALLIETIPLLFRSKPDVLLFFRGAGVEPSIYEDLSARIATDRQNINKYEIVREILTRLNDKRDVDSYIRMRREVVKRVVEIEDFSTCWADDQLKARGLVAQIQRVVEVGDSFKRMRNERENERRRASEAREAEILKQKEHRDQLMQIKEDLSALFGEANANGRGKSLERLLNRLFSWHDILVCEGFTNRLENGKPYEQVDGVIEIDGTLYLVEMKWWKEPLGVPEITEHISRLLLRGGQVRGILISHPGYTESAIRTCAEGYGAGAVIALCTLQEILSVIEKEADLRLFLKTKINASLLQRMPMTTVAI